MPILKKSNSDVAGCVSFQRFCINVESHKTTFADSQYVLPPFWAWYTKTQMPLNMFDLAHSLNNKNRLASSV